LFFTTFWQLNKPLHYQLMGKMSHPTQLFEMMMAWKMKFPYQKCSPTENSFSGVNLSIRDLFN